MVPQSVTGTTTVAGKTITEPWQRGRQIKFLPLIGAISGALTTPRLIIQGLKRSDGTTWEALKQKDGTTDLEFTVAKLANAGTGEVDGYLFGSIDFTQMKVGETYGAIRTFFSVTAGSETILIGCGFEIFDLYAQMNDVVVDDLQTKANGY